MRYMTIKNLDIANGPGCRVSLFVAGCHHHCKGCFNPESWDFNAGEEFGEDAENHILSLIKNPYINGFSILGGEPFELCNRKEILSLLLKVREVRPDISIWMYTGFHFEDLIGFYVCKDIFQQVDVLVDGPFMEDLKNLKLQYCGSSNQRIINVKETLQTGKVVEYDKYHFDK